MLSCLPGATVVETFYGTTKIAKTTTTKKQLVAHHAYKVKDQTLLSPKLYLTTFC